MSRRVNWQLWTPIFIVAAILVYLAPSPEDEVVHALPREDLVQRSFTNKGTKLNQSESSAGVATALIKILPRNEQPNDTQAFKQHSWTPPAAKSVPPKAVIASRPEVPPTPLAPPLPFRYLGRYVEGTQITVFVAHNDQNHALKLGETFAINYKLDEIKDTSLSFTYLPLNQKQSLEIGATP